MKPRGCRNNTPRREGKDKETRKARTLWGGKWKPEVWPRLMTFQQLFSPADEMAAITENKAEALKLVHNLKRFRQWVVNKAVVNSLHTVEERAANIDFRWTIRNYCESEGSFFTLYMWGLRWNQQCNQRDATHTHTTHFLSLAWYSKWMFLRERFFKYT